MKTKWKASLVVLAIAMIVAQAALADVGPQALVVPNDPVKGKIRLEKQGPVLTGFEECRDERGYTVHTPVYEEKPLEGAVFEIRAAEDIVGKDGTHWFSAGELAAKITTTQAQPDESALLPLGHYTVSEVLAPTGYVRDDARRDAVLRFADYSTPVVEARVSVRNDFMPTRIALKKEKEVIRVHETPDGKVVSAVESAPGEGFIFGLFTAQEIRAGDAVLPADSLVATGATDERGELTFEGAYPHGEYHIRELKAPDGWKLNERKFPVMLDPSKAENGVIHVALEEPILNELIYGRVMLTKTDLTGAEKLPGAQIEVRNEKNEVVCRAMTNLNGEIPDIPVMPGRYTFRETLAPEGFVRSDAEMRFEVDAQGHVRGDTVIRDDVSRVFIRKQDESGEPLCGVEFGLFTTAGKRVQTAVTDEEGMAKFERMPYGEYAIRETKALPGYVKNANEQRVSIDSSFVNRTEALAIFTNRRIQVQCVKVDTAGKKLSGVEFVLIDAKTNEIVESAVSDENGAFAFRKLDYGDWLIRESRAPEGYSLMADIPLHVGDDWTEPAPIVCVNIPNHYEFLKTDQRGNALAGARFSLETADGQFIRDDLVSGEDGVVHVTDLKPGQYVIREVEAPEGYSIAEETIQLVIDERYVVPKKLKRLKNSQTVQTGVDFVMTPLGWIGAGLMGLGAAGLVLLLIVKRKNKEE